MQQHAWILGTSDEHVWPRQDVGLISIAGYQTRFLAVSSRFRSAAPEKFARIEKALEFTPGGLERGLQVDCPHRVVRLDC